MASRTSSFLRQTINKKNTFTLFKPCTIILIFFPIAIFIVTLTTTPSLGRSGISILSSKGLLGDTISKWESCFFSDSSRICLSMGLFKSSLNSQYGSMTAPFKMITGKFVLTISSLSQNNSYYTYKIFFVYSKIIIF